MVIVVGNGHGDTISNPGRDCEMQLAWSRIWTRVAVLISYDYNHYTTGISYIWQGAARGAIIIVAGYGHGDTSSNPGPDWLHFT